MFPQEYAVNRLLRSWSAEGGAPPIDLPRKSNPQGFRSAVCGTQGGVEMAEQGYCVKCKAKKEMKDEQKVTMKNGRPAVKGKCPACGTGMYKILGKK